MTSNRYTILGRLAGGGMADIFLVRATSDAGVERYVVLKRVLAERGTDAMLHRMFLDEARLVAQLQHPNIAQVHDIGMLAGSYFYTMEYVHGEDVRALLKRLTALRRPFPLNLAFYVAAGALSALHHAHQRAGADGTPLGIVHRDVSPSNVMVSYEGTVKLLDFGVALASLRTVESRSGTIKGKIAYLSPEQCQGARIDRRSDLFSLGIVLYEMLTGRRLYRRDTDFATMSAIVNEPVVPPSRSRPELSPELDHIVLSALDKDPARRFPTAGEMLEAIEGAASRAGLVLSGTGMGRFMRELFGDRPEPWVELAADEEVPPLVTVTGESLASADLVPAGSGTLSRADQRAASLLEQQLAHAPALPRRQEPEMSPGPLSVSRLKSPTGPPAEPLPGSGSMPVIQGYPVVRRSQDQLPPPPPQQAQPNRRAPTIALAAVGALLVAVIVLAIVKSSRVAAVREDAELVVHAPMVEIDAAVAPPIEIDAAPAAAIAIDAAPAAVIVDAAPIAIDAAPARAAPATIADAVAAADFARALALCTRGPIAANEHALCGIAACNQKQRTAALAYWTATPKQAQAVVERACKAVGITLVPAVKRPPSDPCDDRAYAEAHPLKCQK